MLFLVSKRSTAPTPLSDCLVKLRRWTIKTHTAHKTKPLNLLTPLKNSVLVLVKTKQLNKTLFLRTTKWTPYHAMKNSKLDKTKHVFNLFVVQYCKNNNLSTPEECGIVGLSATDYSIDMGRKDKPTHSERRFDTPRTL